MSFVLSTTPDLCRDPVRLFHPTRYDRACITERIQQLVRATYALQWHRKATEFQHAAECHQTAMCVLGFDHPLARLMEDDVDPEVRRQTIEMLAPPNMTSPVSPRIASPWMDALAVLCCEVGKPRELENLVEAIWHSPALQTERGTIWVLWLCALSCLVFPLDETHPLTRPLVDTVTCTLAHKTSPTSTFSPIQECILTIAFMALTTVVDTTIATVPFRLSPWIQDLDARHDWDLRLEALVRTISKRLVIGKTECLQA